MQREQALRDRVHSCFLGCARIQLNPAGRMYDLCVRPYITRPVDPAHVLKLQHDIERHGLRDTTFPLTVAVCGNAVNRSSLSGFAGSKLTALAFNTSNNDIPVLYVLDGQHRILAARQLAEQYKVLAVHCSAITNLRRSIEAGWAANVYDYGEIS